jgi:hypothetical protein
MFADLSIDREALRTRWIGFAANCFRLIAATAPTPSNDWAWEPNLLSSWRE